MPPTEETSAALQERIQQFQDQLASIPETEEGTHDTLKASVLLDLGKAQAEAGNFETALAHLQDSVNLVEAGSLEQAAAQFEMSGVHLGLSQPKEAEDIIHAAIQIYLLKQSKAELYRANRQLALVYVQQGRGEDAQNVLQKCIEQATNAQEWEEAGKLYGFAGELANAQQQPQMAFDYFREAVKTLKQTVGNHERMGQYYEAIARLLMRFGKVSEAASSFEEGANQYALAKKPVLQGGSLVLTSKIWEGEGQYQNAIDYLEQAVNAFHASNDPGNNQQIIDAQYQIGYLYEQLKNQETALKYYRTALAIVELEAEADPDNEDFQMQLDSIQDSIEQCEEKLEGKTKKISSNDTSEKKGFFGKLKGLFGGK